MANETAMDTVVEAPARGMGEDPLITPAWVSPELLDAAAAQLRAPTTPNGVKAALKRTAIRRGSPVPFEATKFLIGLGADPRTDREAEDWALALHVLAICKGNHNRIEPTGEQLAKLGVSEARVRRLLQASRSQLFEELPRLARRVASSSIKLNWWPLLAMLFFGDVDRQRTQALQRNIAAGFARQTRLSQAN